MDGGWVDVGRCVYIMIARTISPAHSYFFESFLNDIYLFCVLSQVQGGVPHGI